MGAKTFNSDMIHCLLVFVAVLSLFATACTGETNSSPTDSERVLPTTGQQPPSTTGAATSTVPIVAISDPRRGVAPDLSSPPERDSALAAMVVRPWHVSDELDYLVPESPHYWDPFGSPGPLSERIALEWGEIEFLAGAVGGYRAVYTPSMGASGETVLDVFATSTVMWNSSDEATANVAANREAIEAGGALTSDLSGGFRASSSDGSAAVAVYAANDLTVEIAIIGGDQSNNEDLLATAIDISRTRMTAVLEGELGYGPLPDLVDHVESAKWTTVEAFDSEEASSAIGTYLRGVGSECAIALLGVELDLTFADDGVAVATVFGQQRIGSVGGYPSLRTCGRFGEGQQAPFSQAESRSVSAFLRDVPDLDTVPAERSNRSGFETVTFDLAISYQRYLRLTETDVTVDTFDLSLEATDGWPVEVDVVLSGEASEFANTGFGGPGGAAETVYTYTLSTADVDDTEVHIDPPAAELMESPGGGRIVFTSERAGNAQDIFLREPSGEIRRITTHPNSDNLPAISPDGETIVFVSRRGGNDSLFLINADGSDLRRLTAPNVEGGDSWPSWSPDGSSIVFASNRESGFLGNDDLWIINIDGTGLHQLPGTDADEWWPAWSPDGTTIAFVVSGEGASDDVHTIGIDGTGLARITEDGAGGEYLRPQWSPDGATLIATRIEDDTPVPYLIALDGAGAVLDTQGRIGAFGTFTADGDHIIFSDGDDLWSMRLDGSDMRDLTTHPLPDSMPSASRED